MSPNRVRPTSVVTSAARCAWGARSAAANPAVSPPDSPLGEWSGKRDSNPRPSAWKADALAAELFPHEDLRATAWWRGKDSNLRRRTPADLQSAPFGRSGTPPRHDPAPGACRPGRSVRRREDHPDGRFGGLLSWRRDSNPQPPHYK